jgi:hypothetical protein
MLTQRTVSGISASHCASVISADCGNDTGASARAGQFTVATTIVLFASWVNSADGHDASTEGSIVGRGSAVGGGVVRSHNDLVGREGKDGIITSRRRGQATVLHPVAVRSTANAVDGVLASCACHRGAHSVGTVASVVHATTRAIKDNVLAIYGGIDASVTRRAGPSGGDASSAGISAKTGLRTNGTSVNVSFEQFYWLRGLKFVVAGKGLRSQRKKKTCCRVAEKL